LLELAPVCVRHAQAGNAKGRVKDMAARTLLLKLERRGLIELPARQRPSTNHLRNRDLPEETPAGEPVRWQSKYGHPVHALETFVDRSRFKGTCYQAANWLKLGETRGRNGNDREETVDQAKRSAGQLTADQIQVFEARYQRILDEGYDQNPLPPLPDSAKKKRGRRKKSMPRNLLERLDESGDEKG